MNKDLTVEELLTEIRIITARMLLPASERKRAELARKKYALEKVRRLLLDIENSSARQTPEDYL